MERTYPRKRLAERLAEDAALWLEHGSIALGERP